VSKKALGKGLDALIQTDHTPVTEVELDLIDSTDSQPRKQFSEESLEELAASIRENGVIQPVIVEKTTDRYRIVAGERRCRAARLAGLERIPVVIRDYAGDERLQIALIENIQRENLNPIEEATAYETLLKHLNLKQDELAARVGKNRSTIANSLRLLKLPPEMQEALIAGKISPGHARAVLSIVDPSERKGVFTRIVAEGLSVRESETIADRKNKGPGEKTAKPPEKQADISPELKEIEQRLLEALGTKVRLKGTVDSGRIEVSYFNREDLERLLDLFALE
jgi:ParB family chromosome partitioning protein